MSAIAGLFYLDGRVDHAGILTRMLDRMAHRGPDGRGEIAVGPASFGHLLLHTTENSVHEKLPLRDGPILLTAATRLDNNPSPIAPDSAVLLEAFAKQGGDFPAQLEGDFAAAVYNDAKRSLLLARDHFGIKPLYYYYAPRQFLIFASQIRALFAHPEVPRRVNKTRLAQFWLGHHPDHTITFYDGIHRLPAAHTLTLSEAGLRLNRYWALDPEREIQLGSDAEYAEAFREQFTRAVKTRLRTPHKVGFQLSGGLDSSAVTCVGRDLLRAENRLPAATYSDVFPTVPSADERKYIDAVLAQDGFEPHFIEADRESSPLAELDPFLGYDDEGNFNTNSNLVVILARRMREHGVRVSLDGFDGDTTVGHGRFLLAELAASQQWPEFDRELAAFCKIQRKDRPKVAAIFGGTIFTQKLFDGRFAEFLRATKEAAPHFRATWRQLAIETGVRPLIPPAAARLGSFLKNERPGVATFLERLIDPALARSLNLRGLARDFESLRPGHHLKERSLQHTLLTGGAMTVGLERFDYLAGHFQMEMRHPFMDRRLIEFCLAVPSSQKLRDGYIRSILRRGLQASLPNEIAFRPDKADFTAAFRGGLLIRDRARLDNWVLHTKDLGEIIQLPALHEAYADFLEGKLPDLHIFLLFRLLTSAAWLRHSALELR